MIIFFDWDNKGSSGPQDGESDHTGIVERVEDGIVYTVEGNSGDSCRENHYAKVKYNSPDALSTIVNNAFNNMYAKAE